MNYIGTALLDDVLAALPSDPATRDEARKHPDWFEREFDRQDIGNIGAQDPAKPDELDRVEKLYDRRIAWMYSGLSDRDRDLATHVHFLGRLAEGRDIGHPVIITDSTNGKDQQIHDGAHRIYAAYEFSRSNPNLRLRVFWNRGS